LNTDEYVVDEIKWHVANLITIRSARKRLRLHLEAKISNILNLSLENQL